MCINISLKAGVSRYVSYRALALMAQQHEVIPNRLPLFFCLRLRRARLLQIIYDND